MDDLAFCEFHEVECGVFVGFDGCDEQTVNCGALDGFSCDDPEVCWFAEEQSELDTNECRCPSLDNPTEPDAEICATGNLDCGTIEPGEICDGWSDLDEVQCGSCDGDCVDNVCGCPCEIDDDCLAAGTEKPGNPCQICNPAESTDEFSAVDDEQSCDLDVNITGAVGVCEQGQCEAQCQDEQFSLCASEGYCADLLNDDDNCGSCANNCPSAESCHNGDCVECVSNSECTGTEICTSANQCTCTHECCHDGDCNDNFTCHENYCVECMTNTDCASGLLCSENSCVQCLEDADCSGDFLCYDNGCVECVQDEHCKIDMGEVCQNQVCSCPDDFDCCSQSDCPGLSNFCNTNNVCTL